MYARIGLNLQTDVTELIHKLIQKRLGLANRVLSKRRKNLSVDALELRLEASVTDTVDCRCRQTQAKAGNERNRLY